MAKKTSKFTIDDAFDESLDDVAVRVYGSTTTSLSSTQQDKSPFRVRPKTAAAAATTTITAANIETLTNVRVDKSVSAPPTYSNSSLPSHPVLLSIKTGILPDDVSA